MDALVTSLFVEYAGQRNAITALLESVKRVVAENDATFDVLMSN